MITLEELQALVAGGWVRPDAGYHTVSVEGYGQCPEGAGTVGIPGWGDFVHYDCGDIQDYCNRAVICVD
ncbi:MAG: hypothetical protein EXR76_17485 [Myxococcales bacterium]|nr:hypothetical protein [Myxococcales bacterium]